MDWSVKPTEKAKYDQLFDSLQPTNGVIPGNKVALSVYIILLKKELILKS